MLFEFQVGEAEKHIVRMEHNKLFTGKIILKIDGVQVFRRRHTLVKKSLMVVHEPLKFKVGNKEIHEVEIQTKALIPIFSGFFPFRYTVSVDGKIFRTKLAWV